MTFKWFLLILATFSLAFSLVIACGGDDDDDNNDADSDDDEGDVNPKANETCEILLDCNMYGDLGLDIPGDSVTQGSDCWYTVVDNQELLDCVTAAEDCSAVEDCLLQFWHNSSGTPLCTVFKWFVNGTCELSVTDSEGNSIPGDQLIDQCFESGQDAWCPVACYVSVSEAKEGEPMDETDCADWQQCYEENC